MCVRVHVSDAVVSDSVCVCVCVSHAVVSDSVCVCVCVLVMQSCLTLDNCMDCGLSDSSVRGILQARTLEWASMPFSRDLPDQGAERCLLRLLHWQAFFTPK